MDPEHCFGEKSWGGGGVRNLEIQNSGKGVLDCWGVGGVPRLGSRVRKIRL
jgi:hypothetical protein